MDTPRKKLGAYFITKMKLLLLKKEEENVESTIDVSFTVEEESNNTPRSSDPRGE